MEHEAGGGDDDNGPVEVSGGVGEPIWNPGGGGGEIDEARAAAAAIVAKRDIPVDDLFSIVKDHPEYHVSDGVHFNDDGYAALAAQVAKSIKAILDSPGFHPNLHKPE